MSNAFNNPDRNHDFSDGSFDLEEPIVIRPYLAYCPHCGATYPYHPVVFRFCPEPECKGRLPR